MPNLVGIGNSQVPTNGMLGGLAYQDPTNVVLKNIEPGNVKAIRRISGLLSPYEGSVASGEMAFVYDTSKDSDGGAWRKKTQHTSWYREGTSLYRGSRKEFPSIAIITSSQSSVDIYDGDDPNLSLWMRFKVGNPYVMGCNDDFPSAITMKNGMLVVGEHRNGGYGGVNIIDFVKDEIRRLRGSITSNGTNGMWPTGIWGRNGSDRNNQLWATGRGYDNYNFGRIISDNVISVAIFAHDSSPRDRVTGLPYPTIAVGCNSGISIISSRHFEMISYGGGMGNTGSGGSAIYDISSSNGSYTVGRSVEWNEFGDLIFVMGDGNGDLDYIHTFDQYFTQESDSITIDQKVAGNTRVRNMYRGSYNHTAFNAGGGNFSGFLSQGSNRSNTDNTHQHKVNHLAAMKGYQFAASTRNGLTQIIENPNVHWANSSSEASLIAYTGHNFASGWTYGRAGIICLCTTSDLAGREAKDDSYYQLQGTNLVNGDGSSTSGWSNSGGTLTVTGGVFQYVTTSNQNAYHAFTSVVGETYTMSYQHLTGYTSAYLGPDSGASSPNAYAGDATSNGVWRTVTYTATSTTTYAVIYGIGNRTSTFDNVEVRIADRDYSVYDKSPQVFGNVQKYRVNGNSDLMYYTGWSSSNYIWRRYAGNNAHEDGLDHGNGDFYFNYWINPQDSASGTTIFSKSTENNGMYVRNYFNGDDVRFDLSTSGSGYQGFQAGGNHFVQESYAWTCVMGIRRDRHFEIWVNGKLELRDPITVASVYSDTFSSTDHVLKFGYDPNTGATDVSLRLCLFRSGFGAPSKEQIEKMYFDERGLFSPDAACTLVGSTNDHIEALDYDSHTDTLHVGGSGGRADFRGLVRINNNTTPVTRALSAEKGMIAEY
tara:strand:+ start:2728 stop:5355 length:2628 start_codon:yes stop_codon:yes gene_type:complete